MTEMKFTIEGGKEVCVNIPHRWTKNALEKYLDAHNSQIEGYRYPSSETMLQLYGKYYNHRQLPKKYERGPLGECFNNCVRLVLKHNELRYVEGIATFDGQLPHWHSWCVVAGTKEVIDPTWQIPYGLYKGIQINKWFAIKSVVIRGSVLGINDFSEKYYLPPLWKDFEIKESDWIED
jgi:hypothetical protein